VTAKHVEIEVWRMATQPPTMCLFNCGVQSRDKDCFTNLVRCRGRELSRSVLTFRFASFLKLPTPQLNKHWRWQQMGWLVESCTKLKTYLADRNSIPIFSI